MQNLYTSIIRTSVPYLVGFVASVFALGGIDVPAELRNELASFLTFAFGAVYYVLVRLVAKKYPKAEWLLGVPTKPTYKS